MRRQSATELEVARLATVQHGVVARPQLLRLGLSAQSVDRRVRGGRLHPIHRGVYAVGHRALRAEGRWMAAVMAVGKGAVLSHATAAAAWDLQPHRGGAVHVTVPSSSGRKRRTGIRLHRSTTVALSDATIWRGIPVTTPLQTILDLAPTLEGRPLERVLDLAEQQRLLDFGELRQRLAERSGRPGSPSLQAVLSLYSAGSTVTRSEMERRASNRIGSAT